MVEKFFGKISKKTIDNDNHSQLELWLLGYFRVTCIDTHQY